MSPQPAHAPSGTLAHLGQCHKTHQSGAACLHNNIENASNRSAKCSTSLEHMMTGKYPTGHFTCTLLLGPHSNTEILVILSDGHPQNPHLTKEKTKIQRGFIICLQSLGFPGPPNSRDPYSSLLCYNDPPYLKHWPHVRTVVTLIIGAMGKMGQKGSRS